MLTNLYWASVIKSMIFLKFIY